MTASHVSIHGTATFTSFRNMAHIILIMDDKESMCHHLGTLSFYTKPRSHHVLS